MSWQSRRPAVTGHVSPHCSPPASEHAACKRLCSAASPRHSSSKTSPLNWLQQSSDRAAEASSQPTCFRACGLQAPLQGRLLALQNGTSSGWHRSCQGYEQVPSRAPRVGRGIVQRCVGGCVQAAAELGHPPGLQAGQGLHWQGGASWSRRFISLAALECAWALAGPTNGRCKAPASLLIESWLHARCQQQAVSYGTGTQQSDVVGHWHRPSTSMFEEF